MASFLVPQVGNRVMVQHKNGSTLSATVKFVGETSFKPGDWIGVELDNAAGKNDGSVDGRQYFKCAPGKGLFVRPSMIVSNLSKPDDTQRKNLRLQVTEMEEDNEEEKTTIDSAENFWFDIPSRAFIFNKGTKEWIELGIGMAKFFWDHTANKVCLHHQDSQSKWIDHHVDPNTKIENNIVTQQSWVFRATRRQEQNTKDVLCLQFNSVLIANNFVTNFESCRAMLRSSSSSDSQAARKKNRMSDVKEDPEEATTRFMRRRLTMSGGDPNLDGNQAGARLDQKSPKPSSPKALRAGEIGHWTAVNHSTVPSVNIQAYSGVSRKGLAPYNPDKPNQDSMIMMQLPVNGFCNGELLLACFDGHGSEGHKVSQYVAARLPQILSSSPKFAQDDMTGAVLTDALLQAERELIQERSVDTTLSGSTAVVSVLRNNKLFVANVGDSRIIKGSKLSKNSPNIVSKELSIDHKPDDERERNRITSLGGRVFAMTYDDGIDGPARVWLSYADMPGLAMSRSLCDTVGKEAGVISNAETFVHELDPAKDRFIILASDGLWEFMSNQEVVDIVAKHAATADTRSAITELVRESNRRWQMEEPVIDDTTIIIAFLE